MIYTYKRTAPVDALSLLGGNKISPTVTQVVFVLFFSSVTRYSGSAGSPFCPGKKV